MVDGSGACHGSVLAFTEFLHEQGIPVVWAYRDDSSIVPRWATAVRAGTARHRFLAARSRWWITDGVPMRVSGPDTVGRPLERGRDTTVVTLLEPSIEKVGSDLVDWPLMTPRQQRLAQIRSEVEIDLAVVPSPEWGERQAAALGITAVTAPLVVASVLPDRIPEQPVAWARLGLADDAAVVAVLSDRGNEDVILSALGSMGGIVALAPSASVDPKDLIGACSAVVTDTSAWAAVAARVDRPVVLFADDLRDLLSRGPGLYLPWQLELPGEFVSDAAGIRAAIAALRDEHWQVRDVNRSAHDALAACAGERDDPGCAGLLARLEVRA